MSLTFQEFQKINAARAREWHGENEGSTSLEFKGLELGGEVGEVLNDIKKYVRHQKGMKGGVDLETARNNIANELGDVVICACLIAIELNIDLGDAVKIKFNKTSDKVGLTTRIN